MNMTMNDKLFYRNYADCILMELALLDNISEKVLVCKITFFLLSYRIMITELGRFYNEVNLIIKDYFLKRSTERMYMRLELLFRYLFEDHFSILYIVLSFFTKYYCG